MLKTTTLFAAILISLIIPLASAAQTFSGAQITGSVRDASGAVLPGVAITAKNTGTNLTRDTISNETGIYTIPGIPIGTYDITAELNGFQTQVRKAVTLQVGDSLRVDFQLAVGQITDSVTVTGELPTIQSESAALGTVINNRTVLEMPLNGREFYALVGLVPGAVSVAPGSGLAARGGVNFAGARDTDNSYTLDGIDNGSAGTNGPSMKLSIETLQEFKVLTNSYSPEYGRGGGGQVVMTTRGGSNEYRGTLFEFVRNDIFDAKNPFDPPDCDKALPGQRCASIPPLRRNQFGYVFGGPVPKIENMYFFHAYEGLRNRSSLTSVVTIPPDAFHRGDFSSLRTAIRDPLTGQAFPNNIIPQNRWDPVGKAMLDLYPSPTNGDVANNLQTNPLLIRDNDQATLRLDYNFGKNNIYARHVYNRELIREPFPGRGGTSGVPGFGWDDPIVANMFTAGSALIFTPRLLGNIRYGLNHVVEYNVNAHFEPFNERVGICCTDRTPYFWGRPSISATGFAGVGDGGLGGREDWIHEFNYTQNILTGNHNLSAGFNLKTISVDTVLAGARRGTFQFDGTWSGNAIADMLLGVPRQTTLTPSTANLLAKQRGTHYFTFFNDDWKVTRNLTVNLGFRWEVNMPQWAEDDAIASFNLKTGKIIVPDVSKITPGSINLSLVENSPYGRTLRDGADWNNVAPRVGVAYTFNPRTVVRAGYGVFTEYLIYGNGMTRFSQFSPWFPTKTYRTDATTGPVISLSRDPFPDRVFTAPLLTVSAWDPGFRDGYMQNWNLTVQRQLMSDMSLEVAYLGSKGTKLFNTVNVNQSFLVGGPLGSGSQQSRKLYPNFSTVTLVDDTAFSRFHSLQMKLERRFASGLSLLGSYLWSKAIDSANRPDALGQEAGLASFDARHRQVTSFIYEIPLGNGHKFLNSGIASKVLGNWQMSGISTFQSGRPATISWTGDISNTGAGARPVAVGDPNTGAKTTRSFWNPAAFIAPTANTFGNAGRNTLIGPGMRAFDFSLTKNFPIGSDGTRRIQFRGEIFNLFNHPIYDQPNTTFNNADFNTIRGILINTTPRQIQLGLKAFLDS